MRRRRGRERALLAGALLSWMLLSPAACAEAQPAEGREDESRSVGAANRGRLEGAVRLAPGPGLRLRAEAGAVWGTAELVGLVRRAAAAVAREQPGPPLLVGHLSRARGGPLAPHRSHQSGRDVDLGFFVTDENGAAVEVDTMVRFDADGCGRARRGPVCIDGRRTFLLLAAMVRDPSARVQWALLSPGVREQVLAAGRRMGADPEVLDLVRRITEPRRGSEAHDDHLHVRIYCPVDDRPRCLDRPPYHELYDGEPPRRRSRRRRP